MNYLDLTLASVAENLALDEALLLEAEASGSGEILRFWEWPTPTVILGAGSRLTEDVNQLACQADRVAILRRSSGGGTVLLGHGCLCYSLILSYDRHLALREIHSSFRFILGRVRDALADLSPVRQAGPTDLRLELAGTSDLAIAGRKCSGNSQQRKRRFLLHHGTILYAFDAHLVDRYLRLPSRQPDYRLQRKHGEFLTNLPARSCELKSRLMTAWNAETRADSWPRDVVRQLAEEKYSRAEWTRRR